MTDAMKRRLASILQIIAGAGIALFWVGFFTVGLAPENPPPCYFAYERSFPLPDGVLPLALVSAGVLLLKGRGSPLALLSRRAGVPGASGLLFQFSEGHLYSIGGRPHLQRVYQ